MSDQKLWILKSKGTKSAFAGNSGYADELEAFYLYDTTVKNHNKVKPGDYVLLVDKYHVKGSANIERIEVQENIPKKRYRCPICKTQEHYTRLSSTPKYRCRNKHEFEIPDTEEITVTEYRAYYSSTFLPAEPKVSVKTLEGHYINRNVYYSIQEADLSFITGISLEMSSKKPSKRTVELVLPSLPYIPEKTDSRSYRIAKASVRPTQDSFRSKLIRIYGTRCMVTGCDVLVAIEASHVCPYKGEKDNHPENGILLRRDVHALFDADLIGIEPHKLMIVLSTILKGSAYDIYEGKKLDIQNAKLRPSIAALEIRWKAFMETQLDEPAGCNITI